MMMVLILAAGCSKDKREPYIPVLVLADEYLALTIGEEYQMEVLSSLDVSWYSKNEEIVSIDDNGVITVLRQGSTEIEACVYYCIVSGGEAVMYAASETCRVEVTE